MTTQSPSLEDQLSSKDTELLKKLADPKWYLENFCRIKTKTPGLNPFILNEAQKDIFNTLRKAHRVIILKARQIGFSTAITGFLYHKTITTPGMTTALVGYNTDMTAELLDKVKTFWQSTPPEFRPEIHYNSKYEITFPKTNSKIMVLPSSENVGRGYTIHALLATELAMWEKADEKMASISSSVPRDGLIVIESTPRGMGNVYHRTWMQEDNGYEKKKYGWWWLYTEEEIEEIRKEMDPQKFAQEYSLEFLAAGRSVFSPEVVKRLRTGILEVGDAYDGKDGKTHFVQRRDDGLIMYQEPVAGKQYVAGADVSEGVTGGDWSAITILERETGEEVGHWHGHMAPDRFGEKLNEWGRFYNDALMGIEINNHGLTTLTILKQMLYPSLYFRPAKFDTVASSWSDRMGWKTTKVTRPLMIDDLNQALREGSLTMHSKAFIDEASTFVFNRANNMTAQEGFHDDSIFATAVALQCFKVMFSGKLDQVDYSEHLPASSGY